MDDRTRLVHTTGDPWPIRDVPPGRRFFIVRTRDHVIEALAALFGLLGAFLLAAKGGHAAWGWAAFLASNVGWLAFGWIRRHWFLLAQQVGFTATSLLGIWRWLL